MTAMKQGTKQSILITVYDNVSESENSVYYYYKTLLNHLGLKDLGKVIVPVALSVSIVQLSQHAKEAYLMGRNLKS